MKQIELSTVALAIVMAVSTVTAIAQVTVGGAPMYASKDIIDNAVHSKDHTTLVVADKMDGAALLKAIMAGGGEATLKTVSGGTLTATASGSHLMVTDESGRTADVMIPDVMQSNGVIHVVDKVLLPK
ncbi:MAG TPA: fasciclin domain-containing protein [Burkholderiaceae bacterium]